MHQLRGCVASLDGLRRWFEDQTAVYKGSTGGRWRHPVSRVAVRRGSVRGLQAGVGRVVRVRGWCEDEAAVRPRQTRGRGSRSLRESAG